MAHVGTVTAMAGLEFSILSSEATYKELKDYYSISNENKDKCADNFGHSLVVCAPQTPKDDTEISVTYTYLTDKNGDNARLVYEHSYQTLIKSEDTGIYELVAFDKFGEPARITPPFNDYDTTYFKVDNVDTGTLGTLGQSLTLSDSLKSDIDNIKNEIEELPSIYTQIYGDGAPEISFDGGTPGPVSYYHIYKSLKDNVKRLDDRIDNLNNAVNNINNQIENIWKAINSVKDDYVKRKDRTTAHYLWTGEKLPETRDTDTLYALQKK